MKDFQVIVVTAEIIAALAIGIVYIKSRLPKETIRQQGELIAALQGRMNEVIQDNTRLQNSHIENQKAIAELQGQIKVYKELPLQDIARSLKVLEGLPETFDKLTKDNTKIVIDAVKEVRSQHVGEQTIDKQTIKDKE